MDQNVAVQGSIVTKLCQLIVVINAKERPQPGNNPPRRFAKRAPLPNALVKMREGSAIMRKMKKSLRRYCKFESAFIFTFT